MFTPKMIGLFHSSDDIEIDYAIMLSESLWGRGIADS